MIAELLHKVAAAEAKGEDKNVFYPRPSLSGPERCIRQMVYWGSGQEPDRAIGGRALHVFNDGHFHELLTNDWIGKTAFHLHSDQMQVSSNDFGLKLEGRIDGVVTDLLGTDRLYECKSMNHFSFERYSKGEALPEDYLAQCSVYLRGLHAVSPEISQGVLIVKNKNTSAFLEYVMEYDYETDCLTVLTLTHSDGTVKQFEEEKREHIVERVSDKFLLVLDHARNGTLPERPFDPGAWQCDYCKWNRTCWDGYASELQSAAVGEGDIEGELADKVRYHRELGAQIAEQEKEKKEIGKELLQYLVEHGLKKGRAGEYMVSLVALEKSGIDWDSVPPSISEALNPYRVKKASAFVKVLPLKQVERK